MRIIIIAIIITSITIISITIVMITSICIIIIKTEVSMIEGSLSFWPPPFSTSLKPASG